VGRRVAIGALILVAVSAFPASALADAQATRDEATIKYEDQAGQANQLAVSLSNEQYVFHEEGDVFVTGFGSGPTACTNDPVADPHSAQCPVDGVETVSILLDGEDDILKMADSASPLGPVPRIVADGGPGKDQLMGAGGREALLGGTGNDQLDGGGGDDLLDFPGVDPQEDQSAGDDTLKGGPGNDQLNGGPGGDGEGSDDLLGGDGVDTADYSERSAPLRISLDGVNDDGETGEHDNVEPDVERVLAGSDDDNLVGSPASNFLNGLAGDDRIAGGAGDDVLDGGANTAGSDSLDGGDGQDTLYGRAGDDELVADSGDDVLRGAGGQDTLDGGDGNDDLAGGAGADALDGGDGNDVVNGAEANLTGADSGDDLKGGAGTDMLLGADGNDTLDGGPGPDVMNGGDGTDTVDYDGRSGKVTVTLDGVADDGELNEHDNVLPNVENVLGGRVGDDLSGDSSANTIDGGPGEDLLDGNAGKDILKGGDAPDLIDARDGADDRVNCGDDGDLAIVDRSDTVRDCRWIDPGGKRRLEVARSALARPTSTEFGLRLPDGHRFFDLDKAVKVPIASTVDPEKGTVQLATARNRAGNRQEISVSQGIFSVRQNAGKQPVTELRLAGRLGACTRSAKGRRAPTDAPLRRLYTRVDKGKRGRYRVRGRYSVGAAFGTAWLTEDRCDGTLTRVDSGVVRVRDRVRNKTVSVRAGQNYLAPAP
jgi:Ca2+-binding RTX toxin-like protein